MRKEGGWHGSRQHARLQVAEVGHACMPLCAEEGSRESCDSHCRKLTASWVREAKASNPNIETCQFYEGLEAAGAEGVMDPGVCVPSPALFAMHACVTSAGHAPALGSPRAYACPCARAAHKQGEHCSRWCLC